MTTIAIFVVPVALVVVLGSAVILREGRWIKSEDRFSWRLPLCVVAGTCTVLLLLMLYGPDAPILYVLFIAPIVCLTCLALLAAAILRKKLYRSLSILLMLVAFLAASGALFINRGTLRPALRWLLWAHRYKAEVLAQVTPTNGQFKHVEWDGWGGTPVGDWTVYIVFDPTDSLSAAANSGPDRKFSGIPCKVDDVRRLESHWYSVTLGMNAWWDRCGE